MPLIKKNCRNKKCWFELKLDQEMVKGVNFDFYRRSHSCCVLHFLMRRSTVRKQKLTEQHQHQHQLHQLHHYYYRHHVRSCAVCVCCAVFVFVSGACWCNVSVWTKRALRDKCNYDDCNSNSNSSNNGINDNDLLRKNLDQQLFVIFCFNGKNL